MNALKIVNTDFHVNRNDDLDLFLSGRLVVSTHSHIHLIEISKILLIRAESNYSRIELLNGRSFLASSILKHFEKHLSTKRFFRVHAGFIINLDHLDQIRKNGEYKCIMTDGTSIPISRKYKELFIDRILNQKV